MVAFPKLAKEDAMHNFVCSLKQHPKRFVKAWLSILMDPMCNKVMILPLKLDKNIAYTILTCS